MKTPDLICIRFTRNNAPYLAGESAGFELPVARKFVGDGIAVYVTPPPGLDEKGKPLSDEKPEPKPKPKPVSKRKPKTG